MKCSHTRFLPLSSFIQNHIPPRVLPGQVHLSILLMLIWTRTSRQRVSRVFPSNLVFRRRPFTEVVNLPSPDPRAPVPIPQPLDYPRMDVTFLGTCSGGGPTLARNCSSLVVRALKDDTLWSTLIVLIAHTLAVTFRAVVDCAEGTARQFLFQPYTPSRNNPKLYRLSKIFITHMHGTPAARKFATQ